MKTAVNLLFWGYLLVFLRFEVIIDVLPDPLGYLLIALGCFKLQNKYPIAQEAGILSISMIFISIPTFFLNTGETIGLGWEIYSIVFAVLKLIVVYFLFSILNSIVEDYDHQALIKRTHSVFTIYITLNLVFLAFFSFSMNVSGSAWETITIILMVAVFIFEIIFLILIKAIQRVEPTKKTALN